MLPVLYVLLEIEAKNLKKEKQIKTKSCGKICQICQNYEGMGLVNCLIHKNPLVLLPEESSLLLFCHSMR